jgi:hypothetical protein
MRFHDFEDDFDYFDDDYEDANEDVFSEEYEE